MTPAEQRLLELALQPRLTDSYGSAFTDQQDAWDEAVDAVREERCPAKLLAACKSAESVWRAARAAYREIITDLKLSYPPETVDAALSRARKELLDETR